MKELAKILYHNVHYCQVCAGQMELREDHEGKIRAVCKECGFVLYRNPIPAVAILVTNEAGEILLIKRKIEPKAGMWALPSGYMEITQSPEENAIAEMKEETGLDGEVDHCISWFLGDSPIYYRVLSIGFRMKIIGGTLQAGDDASEAVFYPLDKMPPIAFAAHEEFIRLELGVEFQDKI